MVRKLIDTLGSVGLILILVGLFNYSVTGLWDWKSQVGLYGGLGLLVVFLAVNHARVVGALRSRSARLGGTALATLILVVGILALLNFLNLRHHKRIDLSEGGQYSLSEQTRKVLDNLDQTITIIGFFQDQGGAMPFQNQVREYHYHSRKIDYEVVDPQQDPGRVAQFGVTRNGQIVVAGAAKREIVDDSSEEKLTNAIIKVTRETEKVVYFLTGHGERSLEEQEAAGYSTVAEELRKQNYRVESYNLAQENRLPEPPGVIVSAGPRVDFFPNEIQLLEQFIGEGGKFFLLVDPDSDFQMNEFLEKYGLALEKDFVVDATGVGQLFGFGPAAPLAADYGMHPITEDLSETMTIFPTARSIRTGVGDSGFSTLALASSSSQSWGERNIKDGSASFDEGVDLQGPLALAAASSRKIESPANQQGESAEAAESTGGASSQDSVDQGIGDSHAAAEEENLEQKVADREARVLLFGDADFASNAHFSISVNGDFFLNGVSWLAEDTDLVSVRPKDPENRSLTLTATESRLIFWSTVILFPLATMVFGIAVWYRRR